MVQATIEVTGHDAADPLAAIEFCYRQGWTDGLPVVPPTEARVATFLGYLGRERGDILGAVLERRRHVSVEQKGTAKHRVPTVPTRDAMPPDAGLIGGVGFSAHGASKHGVVGLTKTVAKVSPH